MARPENHRSSKRTLSMAGKKSYAVTLPVAEIRRLGWTKGDGLLVRRFKDRLIIEKED